MKIVSILSEISWCLTLLSLAVFIIYISIAARYLVVNCATLPQSLCDANGIAVTDDYNKRQQALQTANVAAWVIILGLVLGIVFSFFSSA